MIQATIGETYEALRSMVALLEVDGLTMADGVKIVRLYKAMSEAAAPFEQARNALMAKLGTETKEPGRFEFTAEAMEEFNRQVVDAAKIEVTLPGEPIALPPGLIVKPAVILGAGKFIAE